MNNDKTYFTLLFTNGLTNVAGVGHVFRNINLRQIIGYNWNKYNAFNIKLETTSVDFTTNTVPFCMHLKGLNWINGYDSLAPLNTDSRVLELIANVSNTNSSSSTSYLSNTNTQGFYKPSSFNVDFIFTFTNMDGAILDNVGLTFFPFIISFTGIDSYKVQNPIKGLRYNYSNKLSSILKLRYYDGVSIDPTDTNIPKGRVRLFKNINFRNIIGGEIYDKYNKFALVVRNINGNFGENGSNYLIGSANRMFFSLSGNNLCFENPSYNSITLPGTSRYHFSNPVIIGYSLNINREYYLQYVFNKPSAGYSDLIIQYSPNNTLDLPTANNTNNFLFPDFLMMFEIIPVVDV